MSCKSTLFAAFGLASLVARGAAHIVMANPIPFSAEYMATSPLSSDGSNFPCQYKGASSYDFATMNNMVVGKDNLLSFNGSASHGGGTCQLAVTMDTEPTKQSVWKNILVLEGGCPVDGSGNDGTKTFQFQIPAGFPNGRATLGWVWNNRIGNREIYMSCAPIDVSGGSDSGAAFYQSLPDLYLVNMPPEDCTIAEGDNLVIPNPGQFVVKDSSAPGTFAPATGAKCAAGGSGSGGNSSSPTSGGSYPTGGSPTNAPSGGSGPNSYPTGAPTGAPSGGNPSPTAGGSGVSGGAPFTMSIISATFPGGSPPAAGPTGAPAAGSPSGGAYPVPTKNPANGSGSSNGTSNATAATNGLAPTDAPSSPSGASGTSTAPAADPPDGAPTGGPAASGNGTSTGGSSSGSSSGSGTSPPPSAGSSSSSSGPSSSGSSSSDSSPCSASNDGAIVCNGAQQFGLCNHGTVVWQAVAQGTTCQNGVISKRDDGLSGMVRVVKKGAGEHDCADAEKQEKKVEVLPRHPHWGGVVRGWW